MFAGVARNVLISAAAFFAVSVVGLLLVPVLLSAYGLEGFGQIALARLFVPLAALAVIDIGFGEIAMISVASARVDKDWGRCCRVLGLDMTAALLMGVASGVVLWSVASLVPRWAGLSVSDGSSLAFVLRFTAVLMPVFFISLVLEGVLKGYEDFARQRSLEVVGALTYAAMTLAAVGLGLDFYTVCLAFLASLVLRAGMAAFFAGRLLACDGARPIVWRVEDGTWFKGRARLLHRSKVLGALQGSGPSLLVSMAVGAAGLAVYEALTRLPKFAKSVLGLLNSTVQPLAVRLESQLQGDGLTRFGRSGLLIVAIIAIPALGAGAALSEPIIRLWLGPSLAVLWPWQAMYFAVPALGAVVGFGGSALLARGSAIAAMSRITVVYLLIVFTVGLLGADVIGERAFIAGQALAALVTFPVNMVLIRREMRLDKGTVIMLAKIFIVVLVLIPPTVLWAGQISSVPVLIASAAGWVTIAFLASLVFAVDAETRSPFFGEVRRRWNDWRAR
jgi:O-antigen/teichoic acid export membrane protein